MGETETRTAHSEALAMLDTFASVGATRFDATRTTRAGDKEWFRCGVPLAELAHILPVMLDDATLRKRNVIVRPQDPALASSSSTTSPRSSSPASPPPCF
jgi:hypothetical protein